MCGALGFPPLWGLWSSVQTSVSVHLRGETQSTQRKAEVWQRVVLGLKLPLGNQCMWIQVLAQLIVLHHLPAFEMEQQQLSKRKWSGEAKVVQVPETVSLYKTAAPSWILCTQWGFWSPCPPADLHLWAQFCFVTTSFVGWLLPSPVHLMPSFPLVPRLRASGVKCQSQHTAADSCTAAEHLHRSSLSV